jgi:glycerophosphoryl diester phosphodiesterase
MMSESARAQEFRWLQDTVAAVKQEDAGLLDKLVSHRGFHCTTDSLDKRPLENTRDAYELVWAAGMAHAECDVVATKDGVIVLCHDDDLHRLSTEEEKATGKKKTKLWDLTYRELIAFNGRLKDGSRVTTLKELLLGSASVMGEVSEGGNPPPTVVIELKHTPNWQ